MKCKHTKVNRLQTIVKRDGLSGLMIRSGKYLYRRARLALPTVGHARWSSVEMPAEAAPPRRLFDTLVPADATNKPGGSCPAQIKDEPGANSIYGEQALVTGHRNHTLPGDDVTIIAGGYGVSSVIAANIVGDSGSVTVYEGSENRLNICTRAIHLNNIGNVCEINHSIVGNIEREETEDDITAGDRPPAIPVSDLEPSDVLELDCEGAEYQILTELEFKPRIIIVEIHPSFLPVHPDEFLTELEARGYEIVSKMGHNGIKVDQHDFNTLINNVDEGVEAKKPPIIVAKLRD